MQTVGDYLKKGREARNISLGEVSHFTKISKIYLDCLEKDEYTKLPEGPYIKGFISSYAAFLGINEYEALKRYDSIQLENNKTEEIQPAIPEDRKKPTFPILSLNKKIWLVLSFSVLFLFTLGLYYSFFHNRKNSDVDKNYQEPTKKLQSTITSKTESDLSQLKQDDDPLQSRKQDGFEKSIKNKDDKERQDNGRSQILALSGNHRLKLTPTEVAPYPLIHSSSKTLELEKMETHFQRESVIDNSDRENIPPSERNVPNRVDHTKVKSAQRQFDPSLVGQSLQPEERKKSENYQTHFENNIEVIKATACRDIKNRIPLGAGDSFEWSIDRIYIWSSLECERPPSSVRHIYYFKGDKISDILLEIRSSHWRTWSHKTILNKRYVGPWRVDITLVDGKLLQSIKFEIR